MKRMRITAILTALSLMVSGLPMTSVYAAELPETAEAVMQEEAEGEETPAEDSEAEGIDEKETDSAENDASAEQEKETQDENDVTDEPQQGDPEEMETTDETEWADDTETTDETGSADETEENRLNGKKAAVKELTVAENVKMAGSNGILYDDVAYLSARNVLAMDEEMQGIYRDLCDEVAESKEGGLELEDVVFAVDTSGDLYYSYYIPMTALEEIQDEMLPDTDGSLTPEAEESEAEEKKEGETSGDDKDAIEEENKEEETSEDGRDAAEEEKKDDETSEDDKDAAEEKKDDETSEDSRDVEEDEQDAESSEDDADASEDEQDAESVEDEQDVEEENDAVSEENLDLIPEMEEETFEEIESVRVENTIDLGYGSTDSDGFGADGIQFNSILPKTNYFESQLTATQKKYYGYLKGKLLSGSNKVSFTDSRWATGIVNDMAHATSALVLSYPDKTDWLAKPGGFSGKGVYRLGSSTANYTFTFDKSKYYSGSVDSKARSQVKAVASQAQRYAADTYPNAPVYGIVRYLDQWVCENGYYETMGTLQVTGNKTKDKKNLNLNNSQLEKLYKIYYNCHSSYGILLNGYGVCESYAKAMSRLLDAVGIPNMYVVGSSGGEGHAWNYVQMPSGSWYLLDSTWNDTTNPAHTTSSRSCLLIANDGKHTADGRHFNVESNKFTFASLAGSNYTAGAAESIKMTTTACNLKPNGKIKLTYTVAGKTLDKYGKVSKVWSSSNSKVAKVDQKGNVTAVAPGTATITFSMAGMSATCDVSVNQIKSVKSAATNKTTESISLGNTTQKSKSITLTVNMGNSPRTAEWMVTNDAKTTAPAVTYSKKDVVDATAKLSGNTITVNVKALKDGSTKVTVKFGGKTVTINVNVGTIITSDMFDITWPAGETAAGNKTYVYTGKAIKPTVKKKKDDAYKKVTFKVSYVNNTNAGASKAAKVLVTGTGKYGGVVEYPFTITAINITGADFSKPLASKAYNGGNNPPATVVKLGKKTLKANKDYDILYNGTTRTTVPAGTYTISIKGKGNYTGTVSTKQTYVVTKNKITKLTVAGSSSVKYTGVRRDNAFTVKIGKNALPASDYTLTWYQGQGSKRSTTAMKNAPLAKGKYTAVITIKGSNLENTDKKSEIKKNFTIK